MRAHRGDWRKTVNEAGEGIYISTSRTMMERVKFHQGHVVKMKKIQRNVGKIIADYEDSWRLGYVPICSTTPIFKSFSQLGPLYANWKLGPLHKKWDSFLFCSIPCNWNLWQNMRKKGINVVLSLCLRCLPALQSFQIPSILFTFSSTFDCLSL